MNALLVQVPRFDDAAAPPWNEGERLAALARYSVLDTPAEPDFDNITRVAALVCRAPIAVVNLIAERRQWFKSEVGLGIRETPLDVSICARTMLQPGLVVVPDLTRDARFDCNPLVASEPRLRFYAGARLDTPEGLPLGTVCVLDDRPRSEGLSEEQGEVLLALARQVMTQLELRRTLEARELLTRELSHRVKNVFSVVSGLAALTARGNEAGQAFARQFRGRMQALAQAHEYVLHVPDVAGRETPPNGQTVQGLLGILLEPYGDDGRVARAGADAQIGQAAATALALIVHELATNAVKYGALSTAAGRIAIHGAVTGESFTLTWSERGGPPVSGPPTGTGFGTVMTARSVEGQFAGTIHHDWAPEGLTTRLVLPLANLAR